MIQTIIYLICVTLVCIAIGIFVAFIIFHLKEIKAKPDSIPQKHWDMAIYMDDIPQNEQNILHLGSVLLKAYERGEYSALIVPRVGEEVGGTYYSGRHDFSMKFSMEGIVTDIHYNTDLDLIVVHCKCTEIRKSKIV